MNQLSIPLFNFSAHAKYVQLCAMKEIYFNIFFSHFQEHAFESSQKYKEGKFIIELAHMIKDNGWA